MILSLTPRARTYSATSRVIVTRDGPHLFLYANSRESCAEAERVVRELLADEGVVRVRFEPGGLVVETARPDAFYARVTDLAASGQFGPIREITSPDDNLQAVFRYLVKA